jgi:hypothetical protein
MLAWNHANFLVGFPGDSEEDTIAVDGTTLTVHGKAVAGAFKVDDFEEALKFLAANA